ncbi:MAG: hypothetical protein M5U09_17555 [Gammaproteobacteria bacterium]|nr:hypothetical protein [Gammaproteobacteria bacterium]
MRKTILLAAAALLVLPWAVTQAQREQEQHARAGVQQQEELGVRTSAEERLSGSFELAGSRQEAQARVNRAIDEAVANMSWFRRGFARTRLREKNPIRDTVRIDVGGGDVTIEYGDATYTTPEGQWRTVTATGEQVRLLQQVVGDRIYQTFRTEDGEKLTVYSVSDDGSRLTLDITVSSPQLPQPLRYDLDYRRTGGAPAVAAR